MKKLEWHTERRRLGNLVRWEFNPRKLSPKQRADLEESFRKFGFVEIPAINLDGTLVAGHQRVTMGILLYGPDHEEDVRVPNRMLTPAEVREYNIRSNANHGGWDYSMLADNFDFNELLNWGFEDPLDKKLFEDDNADRLDEVPEIPRIAITKPGDVFQLGNRRLACGDAKDEDQVRRLMNGEKIDMVFTDPPYNVDYIGAGKKTSRKIENDNLADSPFVELLVEAFLNYRDYMKPTAAAYVFHATRTQQHFEAAMERAGFEIRNQLVWNKPSAALGWGHYQWKHEPFFYACLKGQSPKWYGDRGRPTVWDFQKTDQELLAWAQAMKRAEQQGKTTIWTMKRDRTAAYDHPTQKPVELISYALRNSSRQRNIVADFFGGAGSTMVACQYTGRIAYLMDNDPTWCDVTIQRFHRCYPDQPVGCVRGKTNIKKILKEH